MANHILSPFLLHKQVQTRIFNMATYGCTQQLPSSRVGFCDVAFRRAIADAKAAGGGVIYWPAGSYILGEPSQVCEGMPVWCNHQPVGLVTHYAYI